MHRGLLSLRSYATGLVLVALTWPQLANAQELEPRRWTHLPIGVSFLGVGGAYTDQDIKVDPTIELEDVEGEYYTALLSYVHSFAVFGKTGRLDVLLPYTTARWDGLLEGEPASTRRRGFNDPKVRFAVNLLGSPAQSMAEFRDYKVETIVGAAVEVTVPIGEYDDDRLINLGKNRWVVKPQIGVVHNWGKWGGELTASAWFYEDNDDFFRDTKREQDPIYSLQAHLVYTFRPGLWASLSGAYGAGGRNKVDGERRGQRTDKTLWALSAGLPIDSGQGIKFSYVRGDTRNDQGADENIFLAAYSLMWGGE